jgi:hypothetical protein
VSARHLLAQQVGYDGAELGGRQVHDLPHTGNQFAAKSGAALEGLATRMGTTAKMPH